MPFCLADFVDADSLTRAVGFPVARRKTPWGDYGTRAVQHSARRGHCERKRVFATADAAAHHLHNLIGMRLVDGVGWKVYQCDFGDHFHVGRVWGTARESSEEPR